MLNLVKKDIRLNRLVLLIFLVAGLVCIPIEIIRKGGTLFFALFIQVILCHVLFITSRQSAQTEKENRLLNTLPLSRWSIVTGKYLFYFLCALGNALWLTLIALFMALMGMPGVISPYMQFMMMATGIIYFTFMLPVSYCSPQYTGAVALIVYLVVIFIPSKLPRWLGTGEVDFPQIIGSFAHKLGGLLLPLIVVLLILLSLGSLMVSQNAYKKAEF